MNIHDAQRILRQQCLETADDVRLFSIVNFMDVATAATKLDPDRADKWDLSRTLGWLCEADVPWKEIWSESRSTGTPTINELIVCAAMKMNDANLDPQIRIAFETAHLPLETAREALDLPDGFAAVELPRVLGHIAERVGGGYFLRKALLKP